MKTKQEILSMAGKVKNMADNLPPESAFGDDNSEEIEQLHDMACELYLAAGDNSLDVVDIDVVAWVSGKPSLLDDVE